MLWSPSWYNSYRANSRSWWGFRCQFKLVISYGIHDVVGRPWHPNREVFGWSGIQEVGNMNEDIVDSFSFYVYLREGVLHRVDGEGLIGWWWYLGYHILRFLCHYLDSWCLETFKLGRVGWTSTSGYGCSICCHLILSYLILSISLYISIIATMKYFGKMKGHFVLPTSVSTEHHKKETDTIRAVT